MLIRFIEYSIDLIFGLLCSAARERCMLERRHILLTAETFHARISPKRCQAKLQCRGRRSEPPRASKWAQQI